MHTIAVAAAAIPDIEKASSPPRSTSPRLSWSPKRLASAVPPELPALTSCKHFLNLTNGIEAVPLLQTLHLPYSFVRIQSTLCEQQRFNLLLQNLDASLLLHLALGHCCLIWDFGSRNKKRGIPRALWYGAEFITYILRRVWFQRCTEAWLRRQNVTSVFEKHLNALDGSTVKKIRYYMRYIPPGVTDVQLYGAYQATVHDPDPGFYRDIAFTHLQPAEQQSKMNLQLPSNLQSPSDQHKQSTGDARAEDVLSQYDFRVFLGGMYHVEDFRAM